MSEGSCSLSLKLIRPEKFLSVCMPVVLDADVWMRTVKSPLLRSPCVTVCVCVMICFVTRSSYITQAGLKFKFLLLLSPSDGITGPSHSDRHSA